MNTRLTVAAKIAVFELKAPSLRPRLWGHGARRSAVRDRRRHPSRSPWRSLRTGRAAVARAHRGDRNHSCARYTGRCVAV